MNTRCVALQTLAAGPYLMMCDFPGDFAQLQARASAAECFGAADLSTWRPAHALYFTVMCVKDTYTAGTVQLLYDQETGGVYYLRRDAWITGCTPGTSILAHFVEDELAHCVQPSLLLFDVLRENGEILRDVSPARRYERLRAIAEVSFRLPLCSLSLSLSLSFSLFLSRFGKQGANKCFMTVQWVGNYDAVKEFVESNKQTRQIPHEISCEVS
jgi:hypothetical protein